MHLSNLKLSRKELGTLNVRDAFIRHLRIFPFSLSEEGEFEAREYRTGRQERYRVRYVTHPDFVLTWIIK